MHPLVARHLLAYNLQASSSLYTGALVFGGSYTWNGVNITKLMGLYSGAYIRLKLLSKLKVKQTIRDLLNPIPSRPVNIYVYNPINSSNRNENLKIPFSTRKKNHLPFYVP